MREDSPRWEQINPSAFAHEQDGLRELASYLPDAEPFHVWANVEFVGLDGSINEVDALVLTRSGLHLLELKHWQGELGGDGTQWVRRMPGGRLTPEDNPYILANRKAKRLASVIRYYAGQQGKEKQTPFVNAAVFMHAHQMRSRLDDLGRQHVYGLHDHDSGLPSLKDFLEARPANPNWLVDEQRGRQIIELVKGAKIRPSVADRRVGQLILHPRPFAEGIGWQDFLAGHALDPALERRVRIYLTSRAPDADIPVIRRAAEREFRLLQGILHPGISHPVDLVDHQLGPAVVFDHVKDAVRLDQWLTQRKSKLTVAQKLHLIQDLAEIVDYAHSRRLSHRALHPRAVYVTTPDKPRPDLSITDWQTGGRLAGSTQLTQLSSTGDSAGLELFFDDEMRCYQAPEAAVSDTVRGAQLDVFALGAVAYRIFADQPPAETAEQLLAEVRDRGLSLPAVVDGVPNALATLVYDATHGNPKDRLNSVGEFLRRLEDVWDELTAPEPEPVIDPLSANKGDVLDGGLTVERRLGSGATAVALLVRGVFDGTERQLVLKVARDEQHAQRLTNEAQTLRTLNHWQIAALVDGPIMVGGRTALLLESAGARTLAEELQGGRLVLDLLERYGRDLLDIVDQLDKQGVWHRDLKPANLAVRPRLKDKQLHLCVFDFSLATAPADQISAGTPTYLDPFLGPPRRQRYDTAAERFAASVTLFEMATGSLPQWGDNANPAAVIDEVTLNPAVFDPAIADRLVDFFARALARDAARRYATTEEMIDAWRAIFRDIPQTPAMTGPAVAALTPQSPIEELGLSARARSALERLGVHTAGELLAYESSALTRAQGVPDATRKEILAQVRDLRQRITQAGKAETESAHERTVATGIEVVCATLLPKRSARNEKELATMRVLLGQSPTAEGTFLRWPAQAEAARGAEQSQPQVSIWLRNNTARWLENKVLDLVRDEIAELLAARGKVMSAEELAEALIAVRGSSAANPVRVPQAIGLVRAAVEAELARGGDARVAIRRFRNSDTVLVGRESDDPASATTAADLLDYAVTLGQRAAHLAKAEPLLTRQRAVTELRALAAPEGMPALSEQRLLQLAAEGSNGTAAVSAQGQLYPVGMAAEQTLRLSAGALSGAVLGRRMTADEIRTRVSARFPKAELLPGRPALDRLLSDNRIPLRWDPAIEAYAPPTRQTTTGSIGPLTAFGPLVGPDVAAAIDKKLHEVIERGGFLAVQTSLRLLERARTTLLERHQLVEVDVTAILVERLRALGFPWQTILAADTGNSTDADFRELAQLVEHQVVPAIAEQLTRPEPVLITEAAPLARYSQLKLLRELVDPTRPRPAARLLLLPTSRHEAVFLDHVQVPLTSPTSQSLRLPEAWMTSTPERATQK